jgi:hypothetical protein
MKGKFKKHAMKVFLLLLILLLLSPQICGKKYVPIWKRLVFEPILRAIFLDDLHNWVTHSGTMFARNVDRLLIFNPSPANNSGIANLMGVIIKLLQPFYLLAIIGIALYLVFLSGSPQGRTNAKVALQRIIISMVAFTLSPLLLNLLLWVSQSLTEAAFSISGTKPITDLLLGGFYGAWVVIARLTMPDYSLGANPWSYSLFFAAWFPYIELSARNIILTLLEIAFPFSIFLYSFNYTRGIGRGLLEQTMVWTFMQFFMTLALVALALSAMSLQQVLVENPTLNAPAAASNTPSIDIFTLMIGISGWGIIAALPFILVGLLGGFLP